MKAFAEYTEGEKESSVAAVETLVASASDNATVQVLGATVLQNEGRSEEALALLGKHQGSLEAYVPLPPKFDPSRNSILEDNS